MDRPEPAGLSSAEVQALRLAEQVTCRHVHGTSSLWLSLDGGVGGEPRVFTASQQRLFPDPDRVDPHDRARHILCAATVSGYDQDERWWFLDDLSHGECFATVNPQAETWRTIVDHLLRPGDLLRLMWFAGNNNQYLRDAQLYRDEVRLTISRGQRRLAFTVAHTVTPDNTARMIRRLH